MNWDDLRLFLAVAREGGLAGAARVTGSSPPTLARRMVALEERLGAELFERRARGYALTEEGARLKERAERAEAELAPLTAAPGPPLVKISAGAWVTWLLCREAAAFAQLPVRLRFIAADHRLDIARREAVIGIRNQRPDEIGLAARQIGEVRFAVFGLADAPWAAVQGRTPSAAWVAEQEGPRIEVTHARNARDLVKAGVAKAVLPVFAGEGLPPLREVPELTHAQWLVSHHEARHAPPVRRVLKVVGRLLRKAAV
ncbi:MAG: LysR family transcriptional regulator [Pseudomonadota bacterium]